MDRIAHNGGTLRVVIDAGPLAVGYLGTDKLVQRKQQPYMVTIKAGLGTDWAYASVLCAAAALLMYLNRERQWIVRSAGVFSPRRHPPEYLTLRDGH